MRRGRALVALALTVSACAPRFVKLPSGPGTPASDAADALAEATAACRAVSSITADVAASGSVGGQRLRGHILVGLAAPASARLEAVAPAGPPLFIFTSHDRDATRKLVQPPPVHAAERLPVFDGTSSIRSPTRRSPM